MCMKPRRRSVRIRERTNHNDRGSPLAYSKPLVAIDRFRRGGGTVDLGPASESRIGAIRNLARGIAEVPCAVLLIGEPRRRVRMADGSGDRRVSVLIRA